MTRKMTQAQQLAHKHERERLELRRLRQFQHLLNQRPKKTPPVSEGR